MFHKDLLPILTEVLNDPVPRVVSHVLAAIGNFFEGCEPTVIKMYAP